MANRSYLYACDEIPDRTLMNQHYVGVSEFNYDIPFTFKLLCSSGTAVCNSVIWNSEEKIALVGDYQSGLEKLFYFMDEIDKVDAGESKIFTDDARKHFAKAENVKKYFVLEGVELFAMQDNDYKSKNNELLPDVSSSESEIPSILSRAKENHRHKSRLRYKIYRKLYPDKAERTSQLYWDLGFGWWSNALYYDPNKR